MTVKGTKDVWDEENEVASNWVKFNVPQEDKVYGTLIAKRQVKSTIPGKEGEMQHVYDLKVDYGTFHDADEKKKVIEPAISINAGEFYSIGGKPMIDRQMQNIKLGQKIGLKFIEEVASKTKGFAPQKVVKVYAPKNEAGDGPLMDEEFLKEANLASFDQGE